MKIKNEVLVSSVQVLRKLNAAELPIKLSYKLAKNIKNIDKELALYEEEKQKLINKHGEKDKDSKVKINDDGSINIANSPEWNKDINELQSIVVEVPIEKINIDELGKCDFKISPAELNLIDYLVK